MFFTQECIEIGQNNKNQGFFKVRLEHPFPVLPALKNK